ncbi:uncharacterized protein LOC118559250 [Fundulus heteroclitus]|uniref:uncharacterized protein LOC118559250 n=1 Tax=Fundulus heteroclitus TaxID=8078 RepID=UPI00165C92A5|nr:uncharacterized protein LOC118559250 [Fundulus heteroclitus]
MSSKDVSLTARESINNMQKKSFVAALTRAQAKKSLPSLVGRLPAGAAVLNLVNERRFSSLKCLIKTVAFIWRAAKKFASATKSIENPKWEAIPTKGVITATERQEAIRDIYLAAQEGVTFPATTTDRLVVYREPESGLLVCGGRIHGFREDGAAVPLLPCNAWVSTLLAREAHDEGHESVAATLLKPHRNGAAEAAVRILKKALQSLGNNTGLSYSELQTTLQLAANLANECPIDARVQSHEESVQYVSPNTLLLGRASPSGEIRTFDFANYPYKRLREMQNQVNKFWRSWSQLAGPNLFLRSKWHTLHRNVAIGDIVWLCDQNAVRGQFKLGRVVSVNPDAKGIVRDVNVKVVQSSCLPVTKPTLNRPSAKVLKEATQTTVLHRDVRRLVVLLPVEDQTRS